MPSVSPADEAPNAPRSRDADPKELLLDAAEWLFARRGIVVTSLRAVTRRAGTNIAAVNYHFGSKEGLIRAVLDRRLEPLNAERLRRLDELEQHGGPALEEILDALVGPAFQLTEPGAQDFTTLLARSHFEADPGIQDLVFHSFETVIRRFFAALHRCLPELSPTAVLWRLHFAVGAMAMTIANSDVLARLVHESLSQQLEAAGSGERLQIGDVDERRRRLVCFLAAGFRCGEAPPSPSETPP